MNPCTFGQCCTVPSSLIILMPLLDQDVYKRQGQMWMYRNNLVQADENIPDGGIVNIISTDGTYHGTGFYSPISHITCRILTKDESESICLLYTSRCV